ncbi:MAG: trypsin-like peptidase domain-containing protein [Anaerolineales bacterium]
MKSNRIYALIAMPVVLALATIACGGDATPESQPTSPPKPTVTPPAATQASSSGAVTSFRDAKQAVIQIAAQGTFYEPEAVQANASWSGSGFIIDPSGVAVTNNHVVTGAARMKVFLDGQEYDARVLGASECWDLAVIQIDGDSFPYLEAFSGDVEPGLDVYTAGFPLGDPEFTLTKGIVSKAKADGESSWASVGSVIEHDATINPGNSGGALIDEQGRVVGVNYAGNAGTNQYFAIKFQDAARVIEDLTDGNDVDSIGINGQALVWNDGQNTGIWVASVKSGSPADKAGVKGGDILTTMEGLNLAQGGTMTEYCDIIRSHKATDTLSIEVLRYGTQEVLAGQLNGRELAVTYSFAEQLGSDVDTTTTSGSGTSYSSYVLVQDETGAIQMEVPQEWTDVNGANWTDDGDVIGAAISAATDLAAYNDRWDVAGVFFGVTDDIAKLGGYVQVLDLRREDLTGLCEFSSRNDYVDSAFEGKYDVFTGCDGADNVYVVLAARPINNPTAFLVLLEVNIMTDADLEALDQIYQTFDVVGSLP